MCCWWPAIAVAPPLYTSLRTGDSEGDHQDNCLHEASWLGRGFLGAGTGNRWELVGPGSEPLGTRGTRLGTARNSWDPARNRSELRSQVIPVVRGGPLRRDSLFGQQADAPRWLQMRTAAAPATKAALGLARSGHALFLGADHAPCSVALCAHVLLVASNRRCSAVVHVVKNG